LYNLQLHITDTDLYPDIWLPVTSTNKLF